MKSIFFKLRDSFIAGLIFLLPLLILFVLITKVFHFLTGFTTKIAEAFGLSSFAGLSGGTIVGAISIIILCIICGYLVRISIFNAVSKWVDQKMIAHIPGYAVYHEMALSKLEKKEDALPYQSAAWLKADGMEQPCFLMETTADGRYIVFLPSAGEANKGNVVVVSPDKLTIDRNINMKHFKMSITNLGIGLAKQLS